MTSRILQPVNKKKLMSLKKGGIYPLRATGDLCKFLICKITNLLSFCVALLA